MITTNGSVHIKRYLAKQVGDIAQSIGFGIGATAETVGATKLQFEVGRANITLVSYDFVGDRLIFKASVPTEFGGLIYEVALFSLTAQGSQAEFGSKILTTFDSATETWVNATTLDPGTYTTTGARVGLDSLRHTPAANGGNTDALKDINLDLSGYSAADKFVVALNAGNTNTTSVRARFLTDTSNYYEVNFGAPASGYNVLEATKGTAAVTGAPDWARITEMRVTTNSGAGGASQVDYDGLRIEDADVVNADDVMVSRKLLVSPFTKTEGMTQEVEFALDINV